MGLTNEHFSFLNQVLISNVKKDKKTWKYTFLSSFSKATYLAEIYE